MIARYVPSLAESVARSFTLGEAAKLRFNSVFYAVLRRLTRRACNAAPNCRHKQKGGRKMTTNACAKRGFYPEYRSARLWKAIAFAGGVVLGLCSGPLHAAPSSGGDAVQGLYDALLSTMKSGKALGQSGRFTQIEPVIRRSFDIAAMARLSIGPTWASLAEAQRQQ